MKSNLSFLLLSIISLLTPIIFTYSRPVALQPDSTYQTGVQVIFSSSYTSTTENAYSIPYTSIMTTTSLNASLGIYGMNFQMINGVFGWKLYVASVTPSSLNIQIAVFSSSSAISYLKLCYIISSNTDIDMNYVEYSFNRNTFLIKQ